MVAPAQPGHRPTSHAPGHQPPAPSMAGTIMNMIGLGDQRGAKLCRKRAPRPQPADWPEAGRSLGEPGAA